MSSTHAFDMDNPVFAVEIDIDLNFTRGNYYCYTITSCERCV